MVTIDGNKIQEIKDHFQEQSKREIDRAVNDPDTEELTDEDIESIKNKWKYLSNTKISQVLELGPEKLFKSGMSIESDGWREGYTKPLIKDLKSKRRAKNKVARVSRKVNRKK
jgi:hypothetical protein